MSNLVRVASGRGIDRWMEESYQALKYIDGTSNLNIITGAWPNGKALDYESRDCRFDPCRAHIILLDAHLFAKSSRCQFLFCSPNVLHRFSY
jgi:hypothetical protein